MRYALIYFPRHFAFRLINGLLCLALFFTSDIQAQEIPYNATGTKDGYFYSFWKDSGDATMIIYENGRYELLWSNNTNNAVGGMGWNPGSMDYIVNYSGYFGISSTRNAYLSLYGWTTNPQVEYYITESYGSYNPADCTGKTELASYSSDGATYNLVRCPRSGPSLPIEPTLPDQFFAVRSPKKGYGLVEGKITVSNHFNALAEAGVELGTLNYMIMATETYNSAGQSDITVSLAPSETTENIGVRMRGEQGDELVSLSIGGTTVASWTLSTEMSDYWVSSDARGEVRVVFSNDSADRAVQVDFISIDGEIRQAEEQWQNTGAFSNYCGGGYYSEMLDCNGFIGFGLREQNSNSCLEQCQWYFSGRYPLCVNQSNYWGWENNSSCIGRNVCKNQYGFGGLVWSCPN